MWDLIVSVPDHCLSFYFANMTEVLLTNKSPKSKTPTQTHLIALLGLTR